MKLKLISFLLVLILFAGYSKGPTLIYSAPDHTKVEMNKVVAGYDYPIKPGTDEWRTLMSYP
ncbi:hypothetical protein GCM10020370_63250 [Paenibacillus hodogayensis]